jgi:hypothetical protein
MLRLMRQGAASSVEFRTRANPTKENEAKNENAKIRKYEYAKIRICENTNKRKYEYAKIR